MPFRRILQDERGFWSETPAVNRYSRPDALRILHLHARQLLTWERAELITPTETYSFEDLGRLRTLRDLSSRRISVKNIQASIHAMQRIAGMREPLREATAVQRGSRLSFRHGGALMDPLTQQLAFDFEHEPPGQLRIVRPATAPPSSKQALALQESLQEMFVLAVKQEENPATVVAAIETYQAILKAKPAHAPALINLGTIHYNCREYSQAEKLYRAATIADPDYALAFFDLGNVLDELQRLPEATAAYQRAVQLVPSYADAHYNLALAYERQNERRKALRHWLLYIRLDASGPWSSHARTQARKILAAEKMRIVCRRGCAVDSPTYPGPSREPVPGDAQLLGA